MRYEDTFETSFYSQSLAQQVTPKYDCHVYYQIVDLVKLKPEAVAADAAYQTPAITSFLFNKEITPICSPFNFQYKPEQKKPFSFEMAFSYAVSSLANLLNAYLDASGFLMVRIHVCMGV
ncbi:hypothetical protein E2R55_25085 [Vibrio vulnificus]|nr:hypothetical protein E2R55_25085 [Vibrio vulnificus]